MNTVYIEQDNLVIHRNFEHLLLTKYGKKINHIPLIEVDTLVLLDSCQITCPALELMFEKNIDIIYMSKNGKIKSRILSATGGGAVLRLAQHQAFMNKGRKIKIAGKIVTAKILNQKELISKYKKYYSIGKYKDIINKIEQYSNKIKEINEIDELMGYEGMSAKLFWSCYKELIINQDFTRRDYRPAPDYINSALNLGYSFLANEISLCLAAEKFDLEIGFLHSILYGRNSLTLDIMEEFRTAFIDSWLLKLFNLKMLVKEHFKDREENFYLTKDGFKKFIELYHSHLEEGNWKQVFRNQILIFKNSLLENTEYKPYIWNQSA